METIKKQAESYKGLKFTARDFKYSFKCGMEVLNSLVSEGVFKVSGKTVNGLKTYEVV